MLPRLVSITARVSAWAAKLAAPSSADNKILEAMFTGFPCVLKNAHFM